MFRFFLLSVLVVVLLGTPLASVFALEAVEAKKEQLVEKVEAEQPLTVIKGEVVRLGLMNGIRTEDGKDWNILDNDLTEDLVRGDKYLGKIIVAKGEIGGKDIQIREFTVIAEAAKAPLNEKEAIQE